MGNTGGTLRSCDTEANEVGHRSNSEMLETQIMGVRKHVRYVTENIFFTNLRLYQNIACWQDNPLYVTVILSL